VSVEKIIGFLRGYVEICAEGFFCERFLNICMRREIYLWQVRRRGTNRISACISIRGFHELRQIARKTKTHIKIVKRHGLPFILHRYRHRKTAVAGVFLFFAVLWYLTTHIVGISITGNERIPTEEIEKNLKSFGVYRGAAVSKIDSHLVKNQMMVSLDDLSWIGVSIKGSKAYIEVKERLDTEVLTDKDVPCDIIAKKDGIISLLEVKEGQTVVKVNQLVEKGDLLVSGVVDSEKVGLRYVHSFGEVFADTTYKKTEEYSFEYIEKIYSGAEKNRYSIMAFGKEINFFNAKKEPFSRYDKEESLKEYSAPFSFVPGFGIKKQTFREYSPKIKERTLDETLTLAQNELSQKLDEEVGDNVEILDKKVTYREVTPKRISVTVEYLCREDIGEQRKIDKIEILDYDNNEHDE